MKFINYIFPRLFPVVQLARKFCVFLVGLSALTTSAQTPKLSLPIGHTDQLSNIVFSPDGKYLISSSADQTFKLWDAATGTLLRDYNKRDILRCVFSPDGNRIAIVSGEQKAEVEILDTKSGTSLKTFTSTGIGSAPSLLFTHEGQRIVLALGEFADVWDVNNGDRIHTLRTVPRGDGWYNNNQRTHIAFSPDDRFLLTVNGVVQTTVMLWNVVSGKFIGEMGGSGYGIDNYHFPKFSANSKFVVTQSDNGVLKVWDTRSGRLLSEIRAVNEEFEIAEIDPTGTSILTVSRNNTFQRVIGLWNVKTGIRYKQIFSFVSSPFGISEDHRLFFSEDLYANSINLWTIKTGSFVKRIQAMKDSTNYLYCCFSPRRNDFLTVSSDSTVRLFDFKTNNTKLELQNVAVKGEPMFSPDGKVLLIPSGIESAIVYTLDSPIVKTSLKGIGNRVLFNRQGDKLLSWTQARLANEDTYVKLFKIGRPNPVCDFKGRSKAKIKRAIFSRDGEQIFAVTDTAVYVWDISRGKLSYKIDKGSENHSISWFLFSSDGRLAITVGDKNILITEVKSGKLVGDLYKIRGKPSTALVINGYQLIVLSDSLVKRSFSKQRIEVWDLQTETYRPFDVYSTAHNCLDLSSDGTMVAMLQSDSVIKVCGATDGKVIARLISNAPHVKSIKFNQDGNKMVSTSSGGLVELWNIQTNELISSIEVEGCQYAEFTPDRKTILIVDSSSKLTLWSGKSKSFYYTGIDSYNSWPIFDLAGKNMFFSRGYEYDRQTEYLEGFHLEDHTYQTVPVDSNAQVYVTDISPDERSFLAVENAYIHLYTFDKQKPRASFLLFDSADYFVQVANGFYQCTPGVSKLLHFVTENFSVIGFNQLDLKFNRPDKVLEAIGAVDSSVLKVFQKAYQKRLDRLKIDTAFFAEISIPEAEIVAVDSIHYIQHEPFLSLHVRAFDRNSILQRLNIIVNGVPVFGAKGLTVDPSHAKSIDTTLTIFLSENENEVALVVTNQLGLENYYKPFNCFYSPADKVIPKTIFIGIGVSNYHDKAKNLDYAATDILALDSLFKRKSGGLYEGYLLLDNAANRSEVSSLKTRLQETNVDDKVIVAVSGHGIVDNELNFFFATSTINFLNPKDGGIRYDEIEDLLDSIPARKKIIAFRRLP